MVETLSPSRWQVPRLDREDRWIGGVAAAIAHEVGVQTVVIRVAFVVLAAVGGWGLVLYAATWAVLAIANPGRLAPYHPQPKAATPSHRLAAVAMITIGLVVALLPFTSSVFATVIWPVGFVLSGVLIAWTRSEEGGMPALVRVVAGIVVALGGFLAFTATQVDFSEAIVALVFGIAIVSGIVLVAAPSVVRMGRDLDHERQERIRADERARINAHLHDSVLQTLTLIQQHGDDPARTRQLARRQERELRTWLHGPSDSPTGLRLGPTLEYVASQVEERFDVTIDVVTVGDTSDLAAADLEALAGAASEAMVNAARHASVARVDVYAEHRGGLVQVFIRDTGVGFEPTAVGPDRQGVRNSIVARMERAGGSAVITSEVGLGTEVELRLPVHEDDPGIERMIRLVLVDDHALVRAGMRATLATEFMVAGEAGTVADAVDLIVREKPDVVVCDVHLPDGTATDVIQGAVARGVTTVFLALSVSDAATDVISVIRAGARGYITKATEGDDLIQAVHRVAAGDAVFSPLLAGFVLDAFATQLQAPEADPELDQLTAREQEVMRLLARGYAYKEIARRLTISVKTVETHASAVLRKLQLSNRNELTRWAADRRIL